MKQKEVIKMDMYQKRKIRAEKKKEKIRIRTKSFIKSFLTGKERLI